MSGNHTNQGYAQAILKSSFLKSSVKNFSNNTDYTVDRRKFCILIETCVQEQCCIVARSAFNIHRVPHRHFAHLYLTFTALFYLIYQAGVILQR